MSLRSRGTPETVVYLRVYRTVVRRPRHVPLPVGDMSPHVCPPGGGGTLLVVAVRGLAVMVALPDFSRRCFRSLTTRPRPSVERGTAKAFSASLVSRCERSRENPFRSRRSAISITRAADDPTFLVTNAWCNLGVVRTSTSRTFFSFTQRDESQVRRRRWLFLVGLSRIHTPSTSAIFPLAPRGPLLGSLPVWSMRTIAMPRVFRSIPVCL